jgi:hypothetical protein
MKATASAFYVYGTGKSSLLIESPVATDFLELGFDEHGAGRRFIVLRSGLGPVEPGRWKRAVPMGLYGVVVNEPVTVAWSGEIVCVAKAGKDSWPKPPPLRPDRYEKASKDEWAIVQDASHADSFLYIQGGPPKPSVVRWTLRGDESSGGEGNDS